MRRDREFVGFVPPQSGASAPKMPNAKVLGLIREIHEELSGDDEMFVIAVVTEGNLHVSGSNVDQVALLREAARMISERQS